MPLQPGRHIEVATGHPANRGVLEYLASLRVPSVAFSARPQDVDDPYYKLGTHPDVAEHVWDGLGGALPEDSRAVVLGHLVLVQPRSGVLLAVGLGTAYGVRVAPVDIDEAIAAGLATARTYQTSGTTLDLASWGEGWLFGAYDRREPEWLARSFEAYGTPERRSRS